MLKRFTSGSKWSRISCTLLSHVFPSRAAPGRETDVVTLETQWPMPVKKHITGRSKIIQLHLPRLGSQPFFHWYNSNVVVSMVQLEHSKKMTSNCVPYWEILFSNGLWSICRPGSQTRVHKRSQLDMVPRFLMMLNPNFESSRCWYAGVIAVFHTMYLHIIYTVVYDSKNKNVYIYILKNTLFFNKVKQKNGGMGSLPEQKCRGCVQWKQFIDVCNSRDWFYTWSFTLPLLMNVNDTFLHKFVFHSTQVPAMKQLQVWDMFFQ